MLKRFNKDRATRLSAFALRLLVALACIPAATAMADSEPQPLRIEVQVLMIDLVAIDSSNQGFTANVAVKVRWHDPELAGTVEEPTRMALNKVDYPILQIVNQRNLSTTMGQTVEVFPDGTVTRLQRFLGEFSQPLELVDFPLDSQLLGIRINAVERRLNEIEFVAAENGPSGIADRLSVSDWKIERVNLDFTPFQPLPGMRKVPSFEFQVEVSRLRGYYTMKMFVPLLLIVGMSYLALWVPLPITNTRVSVSVTSMLTLIAYRFMIDGLLPRVSYMTRLDTFIMLSTILVFLSLLTVILTGAWEADKPEGAARANRIALYGFPCLFVIILIVAAT